MKVKYTELAIASGKLNGTVHARNKSGNYVRVWAKPKNAKTVAQLNVRARLASCTQAFAALNVSLVSAWNSLASGIKRANRIGEIVSNSGVAVFAEFNSNRLKVGSAISTSIPTPITLPQASIVGFTIVTGVVSLELPVTSATAKILVSATAPMSTGIANANNRFKVIATVNGSATLPAAKVLTTEYTAVFGAPVVGKKVFVKVQVIEPAYAISTPEAKMSTVATA